MSVYFQRLFFHVPGITPPEFHLLENRDHVNGFQEIKVWRNYSEKRLEKTFRVSRAAFLCMLNKIQAVRATIEQPRMLRLKNSTKDLGTNGILD